MNITALRPRFIKYLEPIADLFVRFGMTPNQISILSLFFGIACAVLFVLQMFPLGGVMLFIAATLDLVDGTVARKLQRESEFGAVFDWIIDKYIDAIALLGIGFAGVQSISLFVPVGPIMDFGVVAIALFGSMINTFIKPVVYAEVGYRDRLEGKINDPLEGVGFFGRPETLIVIILGGLSSYLGIAVLIIAICTHLSALQRIVYLYRQLA